VLVGGGSSEVVESFLAEVEGAARDLVAWHDDSFSRANVHGVYWQRELATRTAALRAILSRTEGRTPEVKP